MTDIPQPVLDDLASGKLMTIATTAADEPHAATFMYASDRATLYFQAPPFSATARNLQANPRAVRRRGNDSPATPLT